MGEFFAEFLHVFAIAEFLCKFIVKFISGFCMNVVDFAAEFSGFSGKFRGMICFRESYGNDYFLADFFSDKLFFKSGNKSSASKGKGLVLGGAAFELFSVTKACVIDNYFVAKLCGTIGYMFDFRVFLENAFDLLLNILFSNEITF